MKLTILNDTIFNDVLSINSQISSPITNSLRNSNCIINGLTDEKETLAYIKIFILISTPWIFMLSIFIIIAILVFLKKMSNFSAIS